MIAAGQVPPVGRWMIAVSLFVEVCSSLAALHDGSTRRLGGSCRGQPFNLKGRCSPVKASFPIGICSLRMKNDAIAPKITNRPKASQRGPECGIRSCILGSLCGLVCRLFCRISFVASLLEPLIITIFGANWNISSRNSGLDFSFVRLNPRE
jgi:hypothetical protein